MVHYNMRYLYFFRGKIVSWATYIEQLQKRKVEEKQRFLKGFLES